MTSILKAFETQSWAWSDAASGHLVGMKAGKEFTKYHHKEGFTNWVGTVFDSYKMYNQASSLGLFEKFPGLIKPLKYGAVAIALMNLITMHEEVAKEVDFRTRNNQPSPPVLLFLARTWNWTPKVLVISQIAAIAIEYQKRPVQAAVCLSAAIISLAARTKLLPKDIRFLWSNSQWVAQANLAWNGNWAGLVVRMYKALGKF